MPPRGLTVAMMPVIETAGGGYFLHIWTMRFVCKTAQVHVVKGPGF